MAYRPSVGIVTQYGVESTRGTGVTAAKKLTASGFVFGKQYGNRFYRAPGGIFPTSGVRDRSWATGALNGQISYEEAHLFLAMMFGTPTTTNPATGAYTHTINVLQSPGNTFRTLTGQRGDTVAAEEVNYLALTSLSERFGSGEGAIAEVSGDIIARAVDSGATLDTVTTVLPEQLCSIADVRYYLDTTPGGLGGTEWTDVFESELTFGANKAPAFAHGSNTFAELVETALEEARFVVRCANSTQSRGIESAMDTDQKPFRYLRRDITGDVIASAVPYRYRSNFALKLESCAPIDDIQSSFGQEFTFRIMYSPDMTRAADFAVTNTQPTL